MNRFFLLAYSIFLLCGCSVGDDLLGGLLSKVPESLQDLQNSPLKGQVEQLEKNLSSLWSAVSNLRQNVEHDLHQLHQFQMEMIDKLKTLFGIEIEHQPKNMYHMQKEGQKHDDIDSHSRTFHDSYHHDPHHDDFHHGDHSDDHHGDHHDDYHHGTHHDEHYGDHHDDYHHGTHHDDYHHGDHHDDHHQDHHFDSSHHHGDGHFRSDDHHHSHENHDDDYSHQNTSSHQHETHSDHHHEHDDGSHEDSHEHKEHSEHHDEHGDHPKTSHSHGDDHSQHTKDSHNISESAHDQHHHHESNQTHFQYKHHHHHHHHYHDDHSLNSKFDFAICNVMPNRAIPEEKQQNITGRIRLWQKKNSSSLHIHIHVEGFKMDMHQQHDSTDDNPNKHSHGFHVHRDGDLSNGCQSTGPHFNPLEVAHGGPNSTVRHIGDLGNIKCDEHGVTNVVIIDEVTSLRGQYSIIGKSLVIHESFDDFGTNPDIPASISSGNAGSRIACCVIEKVDRLPPPNRKTKNISHHHHSSHH